jgi:hypothetical protein
MPIPVPEASPIREEVTRRLTGERLNIKRTVGENGLNRKGWPQRESNIQKQIGEKKICQGRKGS